MAASEKTAKLLSLLPVHDAPNTGHKDLKVKRGRGRPRKVERMPTTSDLEYHAQMAELRDEFLSQDDLVKTIERKGDASEVLYQIKREVARETASLSFERLETEKRGRDTSMISSRRIDALKKIAEIELKIRELDRDGVNLSGEMIQKLFQLWLEEMRAVAQDTLPPEAFDLFFNRFATAMEGFEERAASALR